MNSMELKQELNSLHERVSTLSGDIKKLTKICAKEAKKDELIREVKSVLGFCLSKLESADDELCIALEEIGE